ncbi:MAG: hypothetical protein JKX72_02470 [Robiginitomaculum sp.]|nr:hypothetical protein [Robiginitomaculum sp.]
MIRFTLWFLVWALTLFSADISVTYSDGLKIEFKGWWAHFESWIKKQFKETE